MSTIFTDQDYQSLLNLFKQCSHNPSLTVEVIKNVILPLLAKQELFLDIGAGSGRVTEGISQFFDKTTVVEPKLRYVENLRRHKRVNYTVLPCEFQDAVIDNRFDFILCSQVLYHVKTEQWLDFVNKIYDLLARQGIAMIVLGAARGSYFDFCKHINPKYHTSKNVIDLLTNQHIPFFVEKRKAFYYSDSLDTIYQMCRFSVLEGCLTETNYAV